MEGHSTLEFRRPFSFIFSLSFIVDGRLGVVPFRSVPFRRRHIPSN